MKRAVLEKDILYKQLVHIGIDQFARLYHVMQLIILPDYYQSALFPAAHAVAGSHYRLPLGGIALSMMPAHKPMEKLAGTGSCASVAEKMAYIIGKEYNQGYHSYIDQLVKHSSQELHLEHL